MKKFLSYLSNFGSICVVIGIIWVIIAHHSLRLGNFVPSRYLVLIGFMIQFPLSCYKMWHWEEYKNENRFNSVLIHVLLAAMLIFLLIMREKL